MSENQNRRAFLCLVPDEGAADLLRSRSKVLHGRPWSSFVRWTKPENWHVTLVFFPDLTAEAEARLRESVASSLAKIPPFSIGLQSVTVFPRVSRPRAIAAVFPVSDPLRQLRAAVQAARRAAEVTVDESASFRPHITLGRIKPSAPRIHSLPMKMRGSEPWAVGRVELWRSDLTPEGSVYERTAQWDL